MARAKDDELSALHGALAEAMKKRLEGADSPPSAADLNVIRQFLKDNHIEVLPGSSKPLSDLADKLKKADLGEDDGDHYKYQ